MRAFIVSFLVLGFLGVGVEIIYTSVNDHIRKRTLGIIDWTFQGHSSLWMFPIYGSLAIFFPLAYHIVSGWFLPLRYGFYAAGIMAFEYWAGYALHRYIGVRPWQYTNGWHLDGYVRLDYFPLWMMFGAFIEWVYLTFLNHL